MREENKIAEMVVARLDQLQLLIPFSRERSYDETKGLVYDEILAGLSANAPALPAREQPAATDERRPQVREWRTRRTLDEAIIETSDGALQFGFPPDHYLTLELLAVRINTELRASLTPSPSTTPQAAVSSANAQTVAQPGSEPNHEANAGWKVIFEDAGFGSLMVGDKRIATGGSQMLLEVARAHNASLPSPTTEAGQEKE